jgi:hypothetical protein
LGSVCLLRRTKRIKTFALLENLSSYQDEGESFLADTVMGDETWIYEFTLNWKETP